MLIVVMLKLWSVIIHMRYYLILNYNLHNQYFIYKLKSNTNNLTYLTLFYTV